MCLLHAYANPAHEQALRRALEPHFRHVSVSSEINAEFREYERTCTTALNASVMPLADRYLGGLTAALGAAAGGPALRLLHSAGGMMSVAAARARPLAMALSGPAAGVAAAAHVARALGVDRALAFDMGGTTTDVCLISDGAAETTSQRKLADYPVRLPMVAVESIGAGGGSLARVDEVGALKVGPQSAGAVPGPACYGQGGTLRHRDRRQPRARLPEPGAALRRDHSYPPRPRPERGGDRRPAARPPHARGRARHRGGRQREHAARAAPGLGAARPRPAPVLAHRLRRRGPGARGRARAGVRHRARHRARALGRLLRARLPGLAAALRRGADASRPARRLGRQADRGPLPGPRGAVPAADPGGRPRRLRGGRAAEPGLRYVGQNYEIELPCGAIRPACGPPSRRATASSTATPPARASSA